jgi:hypothetical protein
MSVHSSICLSADSSANFSARLSIHPQQLLHNAIETC